MARRREEDLRGARAGLEALLADVPEDCPAPLRDKIIELASILRPAYRAHEWEQLTATIEEKLGLDVSEVDDAALLPTYAIDLVTPATFDEIVTDGFFREYLDYTRESEAPTAFHFGAILTCVAAAFARRPLIGWDAVPLYPNLYTLLVGPTGTKKSTALAKARDLITRAFPKVGATPARVNVLPSEGSPQGYASALRRRNFEVTTISDGLIIASELKVLIGKEQYKSAFGEWLTDWYDNMSDPWSRALKGEDVYELPAPYICFASASNMTWLKEIPDNLIRAGYFPRHLIFTAEAKRHDKASPKFDEGVRDRLAGMIAARVTNLPVAMPLSTEASEWLDRWYLGKVTVQERGEQDELFAAWLTRKLSHALKVATVWQIADGGPHDELRAEWLHRATMLVDWMDAGVLTVYRSLGSTSEGAVTEAVLAYIERKGDRVAVSSIGRGLRNRWNARSVQEGIRTLLLARLIRQEQDGVLGTVLTMVAPRASGQPAAPAPSTPARPRRGA